MEVSLRKVSEKDWDYILSLRNEEDYKSFFYNDHTISKNEHYDYLTKQKSNPSFFNWIICEGKNDVGYIRILDNDVSIMLDKKSHSKGIGTQAIKLVESEAENLGINKLIGRVMIHNKSSEKIFVKNNFKLKMYWYEKDIKK